MAALTGPALKQSGGGADDSGMTGPHGTFRIEQLTARHTITWHADGSHTTYRDCVVVTNDGVRRLYGIDVDLLVAL